MNLDAREDYTPGWKFAEWELRGVPLRLEIGPKDIEKAQVMLARRDTREKGRRHSTGSARAITRLLEEIQQELCSSGPWQFREEHTSRGRDWDEFLAAMEGRPGFVIARWCGDADCEARIKAETQATIRNMPFEQVARRHVRAVRQAGDRRGAVRKGVLTRASTCCAGAADRDARPFIAALRCRVIRFPR